MSGTLKVYQVATLDINGRRLVDGGSNFLALKAVTIDAEKIDQRRVVVAAGATEILWAYGTSPAQAFKHFRAAVSNGGYLITRFKFDTAESDSDPTPSGDNERWVPGCDLTCHSPLLLNTVLSRIVPTLADDVTEDADGKPDALTGTDAVEARLYAIAVKNIGSEAVTVDVTAWE